MGVALVVTLVVAWAPALPTAAVTPMARRASGVGSQQPGIAFEPAPERNHDLDEMVAAGMTWVRADFFWASIQSAGRTSFTWGPTDAFVRAATARGLHVLALVAYSPQWARKGKDATEPPTDPRDYAKFVHAAALRYGPQGVHAWEIWNEPNLAQFWSPKADPAAYAALLRVAYPAIKKADPKSVVVTGGLGPSSDERTNLSPQTFLTQVYKDGGKGSFDAVGYHPYSFPYAPMFNAAWNTFYETPDFHAIMARFGDGAKPVWGTEIGWPTGTSSEAVSGQRQADDLVAAIRQWEKWTFTGPLFVYTLRDDTTDPADVFHNMGMIRTDGTHKPSFAAIRRLVS